jgi:hypothetical protein
MQDYILMEETGSVNCHKYKRLKKEIFTVCFRPGEKKKFYRGMRLQDYVNVKRITKSVYLILTAL